MPQTTKCHTCLSPYQAQADALYVAGASASAVAKRLNLPTQSMQRHVRLGHVSRTAHAEPQATVCPPGQAPSTFTDRPTGRATQGDMQAELQQQLDELNAMDTTGLSPTTLIALSDAKRRTAESLAKASPATPGVVRVLDVEGLPELIRESYMALRPFPEARRALLAAWRREGAPWAG